MRDMHKIKRRMLSSGGETTSITHGYETMGIDRNRFHRTFPGSRWVQLPMGSYMQIIINGTPDTDKHKDNSNPVVINIYERGGKATWTTIVDRVQLRPKIHVKIVA
jgi:hypothetical protein